MTDANQSWEEAPSAGAAHDAEAAPPREEAHDTGAEVEGPGGGAAEPERPDAAAAQEGEAQIAPQGDLKAQRKARHWAEVGGGKLMASGAPGSSEKAFQAFVQTFAPTHLVTLLCTSENHFEGLEKACEGAGVGWTHLPISGAKALLSEQRNPDDAESLRRIPELERLLAQGERVIIHCAAGMHRTGFVCYVVCRLSGLGPEAALAKVRETRALTADELVVARRGPDGNKSQVLVDSAEALVGDFLMRQ